MILSYSKPFPKHGLTVTARKESQQTTWSAGDCGSCGVVMVTNPCWCAVVRLLRTMHLKAISHSTESYTQ